MMRILYTIALSFLLCGLFSCSSTSESSDGKLRIVATTGMIGDALKNIAPESAEVTVLMGPGVDPHLYKAVQSDLMALDEADIIFYNGLHLEGKMVDILEKLGRQKPCISIGASLPKDKLRKSAEFEHFDPHIWFDVALWAQGTDIIASELQKLDTINSQSIGEKQQKYKEKLLQLHESTSTEISQIPKNQRVLITAHDAFGYMGDAYDIEVKGLQGISTVAQAGLKDVTTLVDLIIEREIKAIFVESSVPKRQIEAVIEACADKGHKITIGGELYSDAMGAANTPAGTYTGMVEANLKTIVSALK